MNASDTFIIKVTRNRGIRNTHFLKLQTKHLIHSIRPFQSEINLKLIDEWSKDTTEKEKKRLWLGHNLTNQYITNQIHFKQKRKWNENFWYFKKLIQVTRNRGIRNTHFKKIQQDLKLKKTLSIYKKRKHEAYKKRKHEAKTYLKKRWKHDAFIR